MKKLRLIILISILFIGINTAFAQNGNDQILDIGVMSLRIGGTYTKAQVEQAMGGAPTKYEPHNDEFGLTETYDFNGNTLQFQEYGIFVTFVIKTAQYPIFVQYGGGVRVGDSISKFAQLGIGIPEIQSDGKYWLIGGDDIVIIMVGSNNKITRMYYSFPI